MIFAACLGGIAAIALAAIVFSGCAVAPTPVVHPEQAVIVPDQVRADCAALWQDELGRDIDPVALADCATRVASGTRTIEDYRTLIRGTDEYAAHQEALRKAAVVVLPLRLAGRNGLVTEAGVPVPWTAVTGFRLVELVAHGRQGDAGAFLDSIAPARGVRVLLMAHWLFQLAPDEGLAALGATLDLAAQHGRYLEVTIFADTKSFPLADADYRRIADQVGAICAAHRDTCALVEIANEVWPLHETQADALGDLAFLRSLRDTIRAHGDIPVSLGSTHADQDESDRMQDGDYLTIHGSRADGDNGWRVVRHTNEQRALADRVRKWAVNDEPEKTRLECDWQVGMGVMARLFSLGDTFHYQGGLQAQPPVGAEATALACRARAWAAVPDDWWGQYYNAGFVGSPVKSFDGAVRVYSSVNGGRAYTVVIGATPTLRVDWADGWARTLAVQEGGVQLWSLSR